MTNSVSLHSTNIPHRARRTFARKDGDFALKGLGIGQVLDFLQVQHLLKEVEDDKCIAHFSKSVEHFSLKVGVRPTERRSFDEQDDAFGKTACAVEPRRART